MEEVMSKSRKTSKKIWGESLILVNLVIGDNGLC